MSVFRHGIYLLCFTRSRGGRGGRRQQTNSNGHDGAAQTTTSIAPDFLHPIYPPVLTGLLVLVSRSTILPDHEDPQPATIEIDRETGRIVDVLVDTLKMKDEYDSEGREVTWVLVPEGKVLLPGLVEYVHAFHVLPLPCRLM
jgi:hypothetical protein